MAYRNTRNAMALVIVHFTESLRGIRAVHAFRRQPRNDEIFGQLSEGYRAAMSRSFQLLGIYWPGIVLVGNLTTAAVLLYGGRPGDRPRDASRRAGGLRPVSSPVLRALGRGEPVLRLVPGRRGRVSRSLAGVLDEEPGVPMAEVGAALPAGGLRGAVEFRQVRFGYRDGRRHPLGLRLGDTGRPDRRPARRRPVPARARSPGCSPASTTRSGRGRRRRHRACRTSTRRPCTRAVAMVTQESFLFSGTPRREHRLRLAGCHRRAEIAARGRGRRRGLASP